MNRPKRLFKYYSTSKYAIESIESGMIWHGKPVHFNDPFDCALSLTFQPALLEHLMDGIGKGFPVIKEAMKVAAQKDPDEFKKAAIEFVEEFTRKEFQTFRDIGVSCFSEIGDHLLLWGHYSEQHKGVCLEFDGHHAHFGKLKPITYTNEFPKINVAEIFSRKYDSLASFLLTKSTEWAYEREWRSLVFQGGKAMPYGPGVLKAIHFGARSSPDLKERLKLATAGNGLQYFQMKLDSSSFKLNSVPVDSV